MHTILKILSKLLSPKVSLRVDNKEKSGKNSQPDIVGLLTLERFVLLLKQCQETTQHMTAQQTVETPIELNYTETAEAMLQLKLHLSKERSCPPLFKAAGSAGTLRHTGHSDCCT